MKSPLCAFLLASTLAAPAFASHRSHDDLKLQILDVSPDAHVELALDNVSDGPLRVWQRWNSWGYGRWRVLRLRGGQLWTLSENIDMAFTKNGPVFDEIPGGGRVIVKLDLNEERWCTDGFCLLVTADRVKAPDRRIDFKPGDTIIVLYDVPRSIEGDRMGVWYGVLSGQVIKGPGG